MYTRSAQRASCRDPNFCCVMKRSQVPKMNSSQKQLLSLTSDEQAGPWTCLSLTEYADGLTFAWTATISYNYQYNFILHCLRIKIASAAVHWNLRCNTSLCKERNSEYQNKTIKMNCYYHTVLSCSLHRLWLRLAHLICLPQHSFVLAGWSLLQRVALSTAPIWTPTALPWQFPIS